jgi:hypothetical protein
MPSFNLSCHVDQGYNFRKDVTVPVGYITKLKIAETTFPADTKCKNPMTPGTDLAAVAVLSAVSWGVGVTDTVYFAGQISASNRQEVQMLAYLNLTNVQVEFTFCVYNYDPVAKEYYQTFHCDEAVMKGLLEKNGDDLNISVGDDPSTQVQSPINYAFQVGIKPQPEQQELTLATAKEKKVQKNWGLTVE